jgi:hypothetical protein
MVGFTAKVPPLVLVPREVPPVEAVNQLILLPAEMALRFEAEPLQTEEGVAVTEVGTGGSAEMLIDPETVLVTVPPLEFVTTQ